MNRVALLHCIALSRIPHVGAKNARSLIAYAGGPEAVFDLRKKDLLRIPGIGEKMAKEISDSDAFTLAGQELELLEQKNVSVVCFLDENYPERLKRLDDAPLVLYFKGDWNRNARRTVAIVGTRSPSTYGLMKCEELLEALEVYDIQLVSGLAYGIDTQAHRKACEAGIENLAVLGSGIDNIYPSGNRKLAQDILKKGALLSEYPLGTLPNKENFPWRNRIIAGLSDAILVIESGLKGGSLITVEYANNYFKDVFALPGKTTDRMSAGCNKLIKTNKAHLFETVDDIAYIMGWELKAGKTKIQPSMFPALSPLEQRVLDFITEKPDTNIDEIHQSLQMHLSELSAILLQLELHSLIVPLPGKKFGLRH